MSKSIELIYSTQSSGFKPGAAYANPKFFSTPRSGVSKVYVVGDWPNVRAAYEALGVPVERMDAASAEANAAPTGLRAAPASLTPVVAAEERGSVFIPEDWRDLNYSRAKPDRDLTLRGIAAMLSPEPVLNREQAEAVIEAELQRRIDWLNNGPTEART